MKTRKTTTPNPARGAAFEPLEGRQMLSASLYNGTLTVHGSGYGDSIQVSLSTGPLYNTVNVIENGVTTGTFPQSSVSAITVHGNGGNDTIGIGGGIGNTSVYGGDGDDRVYGGNGNDYINAGNGNDYAHGGSGNDTLDGWHCNDNLEGGNGNDNILGYYGNDYLSGSAGDDTIRGEADSDTITGGSGADNLYGGDGNDYFYACDGSNDTVDGGAGWDQAKVDQRGWWEPWAANDSVFNTEIAVEP